MARRKSKLEKWLESAISTDETRPYLTKLATDGKVVLSTDGHRLHLCRKPSKELLATASPDWFPADIVRCLNNANNHEKEIDHAELVTSINRVLAATMKSKILNAAKIVSENIEIINLDFTPSRCDILEQELKELQRTLRYWRNQNPDFAVNLDALGIEMGINFAYLVDAISYPDTGKVQIFWDGPLDPLIIKRPESGIEALVMPMRR